MAGFGSSRLFLGHDLVEGAERLSIEPFQDGPPGSIDHLLARLHGGTDKADNDTRGKQFEHVCQWIVEYIPEFADELDQVWPWQDWPGSSGERDCGIDLVARHRDGSLWA